MQVEVRMEGGFNIRTVREAGEETNDPKASLGANQANGCMAGLNNIAQALVFSKLFGSRSSGLHIVGQKAPRTTLPL
jgi:hypothetical protein